MSPRVARPMVRCARAVILGVALLIKPGPANARF